VLILGGGSFTPPTSSPSPSVRRCQPHQPPALHISALNVDEGTDDGSSSCQHDADSGTSTSNKDNNVAHDKTTQSLNEGAIRHDEGYRRRNYKGRRWDVGSTSAAPLVSNPPAHLSFLNALSPLALIPQSESGMTLSSEVEQRPHQEVEQRLNFSVRYVLGPRRRERASREKESTRVLGIEEMLFSAHLVSVQIAFALKSLLYTC